MRSWTTPHQSTWRRGLQQTRYSSRSLL